MTDCFSGWRAEHAGSVDTVVLGKLPGGGGYATLVENILNLVKDIVAVRRCFNVSLSLAVDYNIGNLADFDGHRVFRSLDFIDPRIAVVRNGGEFALQLGT